MSDRDTDTQTREESLDRAGDRSRGMPPRVGIHLPFIPEVLSQPPPHQEPIAWLHLAAL